MLRRKFLDDVASLQSSLQWLKTPQSGCTQQRWQLSYFIHHQLFWNMFRWPKMKIRQHWHLLWAYLSWIYSIPTPPGIKLVCEVEYGDNYNTGKRSFKDCQCHIIVLLCILHLWACIIGITSSNNKKYWIIIVFYEIGPSTCCFIFISMVYA